MERFAPAKLNLTLDVLGKRPDGYHDLKMVMQSITLGDTLTLEPGGEGVRVLTDLHFLPTGPKNLAAAAALRFYETLGRPVPGLEISIRKRIPVCAGMAGGSTDAAAVLRALNEKEGNPFSMEELARVGEGVGSDVPYCVLGGTALAEGRGEMLTPLPPLPRCWVAVCKPDFPVSTPELFARIDGMRVRCRPDTAGLLAALAAGDLPGVEVRVAEIKHTLIQCGALGATMSGTGPTAFGLFQRKELAEEACALLSEENQVTFLAETV